MSGLDFPLICPWLIGREEELAVLEAALADERPRYGSTILITGDAGIGKSRLVREPATRLESRSSNIGSGKRGSAHQDTMTR